MIGVETVCKAAHGAHLTEVGLVTEVVETEEDLVVETVEDSEAEIETVHRCDVGLPHVEVPHGVVVVLGVDHAALGGHHPGEDRLDVQGHHGVVGVDHLEGQDHLNAKHLLEVVEVEDIRAHPPPPLRQVKYFAHYRFKWFFFSFMRSSSIKQLCT